MRKTLVVVFFMIALVPARKRYIRILSSFSPTFSQNVYNVLALDKSSMVYSPHSIRAAMGMVVFGARRKTAGEIMKQVFNADDWSKMLFEFNTLYGQWLSLSDVRIYRANALFANPRIQFEETLANWLSWLFGALTTTFDLQASGGPEKPVNDFVKHRTKGWVQDLLPAGTITSSTELLFVSAISFSAAWSEQFDEGLTKKKEFKTLDGIVLELDTMSSPRLANVKQGVLGSDVLELPFENTRFSMYIVLPQEVDGIWMLESMLLSNDAVNELFEGLKPTSVALSLPKFKIESSFRLNEPLQELGVERAFSKYAELRGITEKGRTRVTDIYHKAVFEVNEAGTGTSGVTTATDKQVSDTTFTFNADHPFIFFLKDKETNIVLFQGKFTG